MNIAKKNNKKDLGSKDTLLGIGTKIGIASDKLGTKMKELGIRNKIKELGA